jgi:hypothetical protein
MVLKLDLFLLNKSIPFVKQKEPGTWPFFSSLVQKIALTLSLSKGRGYRGMRLKGDGKLVIQHRNRDPEGQVRPHSA